MPTNTTAVAVSNEDQERAWNGPDGAHWAAHHERFEAALARYQPPFLAAAAIRSADRVLDVGCGTGATTRAAARAARTGQALGVDLSSQMVDVARRLAHREGLAHARFERADAQIHPFGDGAFDVVISQNGAMFFGRPDEAFANLGRSLTPGGRLVLLAWQPPDRQEWIRAFAEALAGRTPPAPDLDRPGPFSLSDPARVDRLLSAAGFCDVDAVSLSESVTYGRTVDEAYELLLRQLGWMLDGQDESRRDASLDAFRRTLAAHQTADGVRYGSATWLFTAQRW